MIELDFRGADSKILGEENGLDIAREFENYKDRIAEIITDLYKNKDVAGKGLRWMDLGYSQETSWYVKEYAALVENRFDNILVLGIGGSALGGLAVTNALLTPYWNMLTKEAVNTYLAEIYTTHWNGQTADQATVHDVCYENDIDDSENYYSRTIDGVTYTFVWVYDDGQGNVRISGGAYNYSGIPLDGSNYIRELAEAYMEERNKSTDINVETDYADEQSEEPQEEQL